MGNVIAVIIQLLSGALGGNAVGTLIKKLSLGTVLNSIVGIVGGGLGGQILGLLGLGSGTEGLDMAGILGSIASGGVGGGVLLVIIGLIKKALAK
jgi:hypothetical protein